MTRGRKRKLRRTMQVAIGMAAGLPPAAFAQEQPQAGTLEEVVVTAQKREENLQSVPLSIQAIGTTKLEELHVTNFQDYVKLLPSVSFQGAGNGSGFGPGFNRAYMRGVASGDTGNHSGPRPSVGMYLDEQPITTIQGALDIHIYDIARVEALAGPQGTLYGASSQAGTIRIITNKPDTREFKASYDLQGSFVKNGGGAGYTGEGFVNVPLSDRAAVRLVGWVEHDPGYIDNVAATLTYPTEGKTINNASVAKGHYNDADISGARAALKVDLNDNWTVTPAIMGQDTQTHGFFGFDPALGDLKVAHFLPERTSDRWYQAALTLQGKISNFDVVYAGAALRRHDETQQDYTDYSFFYDSCCSYASSAYIFDDAGNAVANPSQFIRGKDHYKTDSHELRVSSPKDWRFRFVAGLYWQRQRHEIEQRYVINNIATSIEVRFWPDTWWLTEQVRVDRDSAFFTEMNYDLTPKLTLTGGIRFFKAKNSLEGFFGYGLTNDFTSSTGEKSCPTPNVRGVNGAPCTNLDRQLDESGNTPKLNLSYKITDDHLVYATWSKGFRPGGINRRNATGGVPLPPYTADFLKNYEVGWKTTWLGNRLRFNGALFQEDWKDFQFSYLGLNSLTEIRNAGSARIRGLETEVQWAATNNLTISGGLAFMDPKLTEDFCKNLDTSTGKPKPRATCEADFFAPSGTQLPVTSKVKGDVTSRYTFNLGGYDAHVQGTLTYQGSALSTLIPNERRFLPDQRAFEVLDLTAGLHNDRFAVELVVNNALDKRADVSRFVQCPVFQPGTGGSAPFSSTVICGNRAYIQTNVPRTIGIKFGQKF
ncbi:MAG: TonB-dependent receptor [Steroidobacteraceae bacterium]